MTEAEGRAAVVAETMTWIGTRYHHHAMVKVKRDAAGRIVERGGVDCATLLAAVYVNAGIIPPFEVPYYPPDWHLHKCAELYLGIVTRHAREITEDQAKPGDIVMYRYGLALSHGAIIINPGWPEIVHALYLSGSCHRDHGRGGQWGATPRRFFSMWT
jgi:cell wall-associated NlpC family hydrolase